MTGDIIPIGLTPPARSGGAALDEAALATLRHAVETLERSTLVGRLSAMAGRPLDLLGRALPAPVATAVAKATDLALKAALRVALTSLPKRDGPPRGRLSSTIAAAASGALGGAIGLSSLPVELPVSTVLMLRAIAQIATEEGEDLADPEAALACLEVFAFGSGDDGGDLSGSRYFAVRSLLAKSLGEAARIAAGRGLADKGGPVLVRLLSQIGARFGLVVSQKVAAVAIPVVGVIGGAAVNAAFVEHFRTVARAHFGIRRLERTYGRDSVREQYETLRSATV